MIGGGYKPPLCLGQKVFGKRMEQRCGTDQFRADFCYESSCHHRQDHLVVVCHLDDDNESGNGCLGYAGEVSNHSKDDGSTCRYRGKEVRNVGAESRPCRKRWRHDPPRNSADVGNDGGNHFQQAVAFR